jgi:hypothetical protein
MKTYGLVVVSLGALLVGACSSQKEPAQQAVTKAEDALSSIHDEAAKFAPDNLQGVEGQVAALKQTYISGDYAKVLATAPAVKTAISSLRHDADAKQAEADAATAKVKQEWRILAGEVPKMVTDVKAAVDNLTSSKKLPKGVNKASFETVKTDTASLDPMWTDANNAVASGDYAGAVSKGQAVKDKATALMQTLGIKQG